MVFFTCNHCGDSIKKPAVEKHYKFKCRKTPSLCCIDCLKDFHGDEYVAHTKCVTEEERYSGKDFVVKPSKNSGQKKQDTWVEIVRSILSTKEYEVSPQVRGLFQKLQSYDNVPRKKVKFENFVSNSLKVNKRQAEEVWGVLEKALELLKAAREAEQQSKKGAVVNANQSVTEGNTNGAENGDAAEDPTPNTEKKKKRKHSENGHADGENGTEATVDNQEQPTKQKKDKSGKKMKLNQEDQPEADADKPAEVLEQNKINKKSKKERNMEEEPAAEDAPTGSQEPEKKRIKTKALQNGNAANNADSTNFEWNKVIFGILAKHNDEISLDKLKSKVLKKYLAHLQVDEVTHKIEKTFKKKIKKSGLLVENNIVKVNVK